jgi:hypothetical protein
MRWLKSPMESIYGLLGHPAVPTESILDCGLEDIRESMLELLGDTGPKRYPQVTRRIRYAGDIQGLWYLRGDLMGALAAMHGEVVARERIQAITELFQGLLPGSLASRPSPLVG